MSLIIAAKSPTDVVIGSETLVIKVDRKNPEREVSRSTNQKKIFKVRLDTAIGIAGTFNGAQMNQFMRTMVELVENNNLTNLSDIAGQVAAWGSSTFKLEEHHEVEFIVAGFNSNKPAIELVTSSNSFQIGTPRGQFLIGGDKQYGPQLEKGLNTSMTTQEVKETIRGIINRAKKENPALGGATDLKILSPS
jgi:20S proteasome alpha/beta subunit